MDLSSFAKRMDTRAKQLERTSTRVLKVTATAAHQAFLDTTPVLTGNAKANTNVFPTARVEVRDLRLVGGSGPAASLALANAQRAISGVTVRLNNLYLTNGVDYIRDLDAGFSQKGGFMVNAARIAGISAAKSELAKGIFRVGARG